MSAQASHTWVSSVFFRLWRTWFDFFFFFNETVSVHALPHIKSTDYDKLFWFYLPGCELSSKVPFYTFQADEEEDLEHFLELRTVCTTVNCPIKFKSYPNHFNKMCKVGKCLCSIQSFRFVVLLFYVVTQLEPTSQPRVFMIAVGLSGRECQGGE